MGDVVDKIGQLIRDPSIEVDMVGFLFALLVSALVAVFVSALYRSFYEHRTTGSQIHRSFLLLGPSITALFIAVQFSLPLSLGLLGALSIVRFRTPIKEPEEVGFIMLLIASSVVTATFQFLLLAVLLAISTAFLLLRRHWSWFGATDRVDGMLLVVLAGRLEGEGRAALSTLVNRRLRNGQLQGVAFTEGMTTLHFSFSEVARSDLDLLQDEIGQMTTLKKLNVFFNRQGAVV